MSEDQSHKHVANFMGAVAHLLGGQPGRLDEVIAKVDLILSGNEPHALQLLQFGERVRQTGRPMVWFHFPQDWNNMPQIGLVARSGSQILTFENCLPWMRASDDRVHLIPDNFKMGAFRFDDDLQLRHIAKSPARSFNSAKKSVTRAFVRLREIEAAQRERGDVFALPQRHKAA